jgi:hypothetical protein
MKNEQKAIETPSASWGFALLAAIVTVLWGSTQFSLWHTIIGITLLLMLLASSSNSQISPRFLLVQSSLLSLCVLLILSPFLRFALTWSGWMAKGIIIFEVAGKRYVELGTLHKGILYAFECFHIFALIIWLLVGLSIFFILRSKSK